MRDSARYAWWLLIFLFTLLIAGNTFLFWTLFKDSTSQSLPADNWNRGIDFQIRYVLALERFGVGKALTDQAITETLKVLDKAFAPYEAALYRATLEAVFGFGNPQKTLSTLPDLPSENLTPPQRRWYASHWQAIFSKPVTPEQVPAILESLQGTPSPLASQLLELVLYQRAGDQARANALRESLRSKAGGAVLVLGAIIGTVCFAGLAGFVLIAVYLMGSPKLPRRPAPDESPFVYDPLLWALVIFLLVLLNAPAVAHALNDLFHADASNVVYLLALLLTLMYLASLRSQPGALGQIRWFTGSWWKQLGAALWGYAVYVPFLGMLLLITLLVAPALPSEQTNPISERVGESQTTLQWLWTFVQAAVLAPIVEEFVFRGVLFQVLWQRTGRVWLSAFVSGYLFAVIHPQFLGGIFPITVLGTILALVYAHTRSLLPCMLIHAFNNGLITLLLWSVGG
jgi:membrane protease YdiL (CAAX protease family)